VNDAETGICRRGRRRRRRRRHDDGGRGGQQAARDPPGVVLGADAAALAGERLSVEHYGSR
jgi:hypothetical protein